MTKFCRKTLNFWARSPPDIKHVQGITNNRKMPMNRNEQALRPNPAHPLRNKFEVLTEILHTLCMSLTNALDKRSKIKTWQSLIKHKVLNKNQNCSITLLG